MWQSGTTKKYFQKNVIFKSAEKLKKIEKKNWKKKFEKKNLKILHIFHPEKSEISVKNRIDIENFDTFRGFEYFVFAESFFKITLFF